MLSVLKKALSFGKKAFIVVAVYFVVISLFFHFTSGEKPKQTVDPIKKNRAEIYKVINDKELNSSKQGQQGIIIYRGVSCGLIGEGCTINPDDGDKYFKTSFFGKVTGAITYPLVNPPASGMYWTYDGLNKANIIPSAYAAEGIGFASIKPYLNFWSSLRNIAFIALVLILIAIGFMIMFRVKLNPQTIITVENSLPRLFIGMLFIVFSFAIAGFLIDLMYVVIVLAISVLGKAGGLDVQKLTESYIQAKPASILGKLAGGEGRLDDFINIFWQLPHSLLSMLGVGLNLLLRMITMGATVIFILPKLQGIINDFLKLITPDITASGGLVFVEGGLVFDFLNIISNGLSWLISSNLSFVIGFILLDALIALIIFLTLITVFFRIFFLLITTYLRILLLILFSPLYLLLAILPNQQNFTFTNWLRYLAGELLAFPALVSILILGSVIVNLNFQNQATLTPPFTFGIRPDALAFILGMALLFMTPDLLKSLKKVIHPKESGFPSFGPEVFFGALTGGVSAIGTFAQQSYYYQNLGNRLKGLRERFGGALRPGPRSK